MSTPTGASGKFTSAYSDAARILSPSTHMLNCQPCPITNELERWGTIPKCDEPEGAESWDHGGMIVTLHSQGRAQNPSATRPPPKKRHVTVP